MPRSQRRWTGRLFRRGLLTVITVTAIAAFGLATGGGAKSLALTPTAAASSSSGFSVSAAVSQTNGSVNVVAIGPNHSLRFYWNVGGTWYGPLGLAGSGMAWSAPSMAAEPDGNLDILVEGPSHTLNSYWDASGTWYGPLQVGGPGTTYSTPSAFAEQDSGHLDVAAQGASNTLDSYWETGGQWYGPNAVAGPNSTFAAPSVFFSTGPSYSAYNADDYGNDQLYISTQGPNHDLVAYYYETSQGRWEQGTYSNDNTAMSAPSENEGYSVFEGPNNSLWNAYSFDTGGSGQIIGAGNVFSAPSLSMAAGTTIAFQGPSRSLYYMYDQNYDCCDDNYQGPLQLGAPGSVFSAPSDVQEGTTNGTDYGSGFTGNTDIFVEGPNNTLLGYWIIGGTGYGPLQVAGAGTTFSSNS